MTGTGNTQSLFTGNTTPPRDHQEASQHGPRKQTAASGTEPVAVRILGPLTPPHQPLMGGNDPNPQ